MRLDWIEDILAIADAGSLSKAADRRNLTQSAFSRRIQAIEDALGVELLDRSKRPTQLNAGVAAHRDHFIRLTAEIQQLVADLRYGAQVEYNRIAMASQHALTTVFAPRLIQRLEHRGTNLSVRLVSENLDECIGSLLAGRTDMALIFRRPGNEDPITADYVKSRLVSMDKLIPVCGEPLETVAGRGERLPIVDYPGEVYLGRILRRTIFPSLRNLYTIDQRVETALTLAALELAESGTGIAWVPRSLARSRIEAGAVWDLSDTLPTCDLDVIALRLAGNSRPALARAWRELGRIHREDQAMLSGVVGSAES